MVEFITGPGRAWEECEAKLDSKGTSLPLYHRAIWARAAAKSGAESTFAAIRPADGECRAGFAIESTRSRALPGHRLLSIQRLGIGAGGLDESSLEEGLAQLSARARIEGSVLRVTIDAFAMGAGARERTGDVLRRHGYVNVAATRSYERTLLLDLAPSEETLFAGLHKNARQGVRNIARYPVRMRTVESTAIASRLQELGDQTRQRTTGERRHLDWPSLIELSLQAPHLSRIAILERTDGESPDSILAFAWGCMHGDVAQYSESGSTRTDDMKVSTSYALLWDLILWARRGGARWFDFGGVTSGGTHSADPLGGISDFKRRFSQHEVEVGQQWELYPHPRRAVVANVISRSAALLRVGMGWVRD